MDWGFLKALLPWLPPMLTLVGWSLVNRQNNQREKRKDVRSAADQCKKLARESTQLAVIHWKSTNDASAWQVKALLEEMEIELRRFPAGEVRECLTNKCSVLIDVILDGDFDAATRQPKLSGDPLMKCIAGARQSFLHEIEFQFEKLYP
jgi:16S rRNA G1207 methylase RsmC